MISFTCPVCNLEYQYADDMAGKKIRCAGPSCNQKLLIPPPTAPPTLIAPIAPIVPAGPSERLWNYMENGQAKGPVAAAELKRLIVGRRLTPKDPVWTTGMGDWRPLHEALPEMFRKPGAAKPRKPTKAAGGERGGLYEKIGVGVFAVVAAVILVGLFMILFPLMHPSAASAPDPSPARLTPPQDPPKKAGDDAAKKAADDAQAKKAADDAAKKAADDAQAKKAADAATAKKAADDAQAKKAADDDKALRRADLDRRVTVASQTVSQDERNLSDLNDQISAASGILLLANAAYQRAESGSSDEVAAGIAVVIAQRTLDELAVNKNRVESNLSADRARHNQLRSDRIRLGD